MSVPLVDYDLVVQVLGDVEKVRLVSAVGLVILLYDHVLSLPDEVELVWSARFTSSKILFLALRYFVPIVMIVNTVVVNSGTLLGYATFSSRLATGSDDYMTDAYGACSPAFVDPVGPQSYINILHPFHLHRLKHGNRGLDDFPLAVLDTYVHFPNREVALKRELAAKLVFNPFVRVCAPATPFAPAHFRVLWMPEVLFQFMMLCALGWKILMHPQTFNALLRDGYLYFFCLSTIMLVVRVRTSKSYDI
ncbi:hypothetical protein B0H13DRAFT_1881339 [Mycena leptocephala]|nr:hypothetical protein B0H13DRAFT_1881339 [Mycena leptocephala]